MTTQRPVAIAVMGAGLIGRRHIDHILADADARLAAIVDPSPAAAELAAVKGVAWWPSLAELLAKGPKPDGIVIATPNPMHLDNGLEAIAAGIPILVEKPIADDVAAGSSLVAAAETADIPLLVGHHRRHNPMIAKAKSIIDSGRLGRVITVHGFVWLMKPDDYFDAPWRRQLGAGPVLLNLIHDIDLLRHLCGDVAAVQAMESNAVRGHAVEDTAVMILRFVSGALGTVNVCDATVAPWSWEQTTGENPVYPRTGESCYQIGGTHGALSIPKLEVWSHPEQRSWWAPIHAARTYAADEDPLRLQIAHFVRVIRGEARPLVSGREGLKTLQVIAAVKAAARSGQSVAVG